MADVREVVDGGPSDAAGGRVRRDDLRVRLLDREELAGEGVVLGVADLGTRQDVVEVLVPAQLVAQRGGTGGRSGLVLGKSHIRIVGAVRRAFPRTTVPPSMPAVQRLKAVLGLASLLCVAFPARAGSRVPPVASYRIEATWDGEAKSLAGRQTLTFVNRTGHAFPDVLLHLYLNGFRNTRSTLWRALPPPSGSGDFGACELKRVALPDGTDLTRRISFSPPANGNPDDRTLALVPLPRPVGPGETLVLEIDFESRLPRGLLRTGWKDDFVFAGQWFPKLAKATGRVGAAGPSTPRPSSSRTSATTTSRSSFPTR